jgi:hypothetical protein
VPKWRFGTFLVPFGTKTPKVPKKKKGFFGTSSAEIKCRKYWFSAEKKRKVPKFNRSAETFSARRSSAENFFGTSMQVPKLRP